ncbi:RNase A-like domain-containing protein [Streptomyces tanashiensis]|uniref:RNase A-like domain-containing protein n=1 Tax=Streptomyces tanashiensis TaxID=67367 RepID=UPI0033E6ED72
MTTPPAAHASARADRAATFPDRVTAQWATQQVISLNEQVIHRWLAQFARQPLVIEAAWPSRPDPVGTLLTTGMALAGQDPIPVRAARVVLRRTGSGEPGVYPFTACTPSPCTPPCPSTRSGHRVPEPRRARPQVRRARPGRPSAPG